MTNIFERFIFLPRSYLVWLHEEATRYKTEALVSNYSDYELGYWSGVEKSLRELLLAFDKGSNGKEEKA